uniref:Serine/threonine-protein phosphatase n=1 Tax=Eutreptiella gymnastica TaxID=73025 RepID=A0A7S1J1G0_9EUGL|mmetsp:Transcript_59094/g.105432  ORF Transcript_59094/g.105432 Transcript_59094/m.105432 type:complete len:614 (+) Transcript_59094:186-2027(+)
MWESNTIFAPVLACPGPTSAPVAHAHSTSVPGPLSLVSIVQRLQVVEGAVRGSELEQAYKELLGCASQLVAWQEQLQVKEEKLSDQEQQAQASQASHSVLCTQFSRHTDSDPGLLSPNRSAVLEDEPMEEGNDFYSISSRILVLDADMARLEDFNAMVQQSSKTDDPTRRTFSAWSQNSYSSSAFDEDEGMCSQGTMQRLMSVGTEGMLSRSMSGPSAPVPAQASELATAVIEAIDSAWLQEQDDTFPSLGIDRGDSFLRLLLPMLEYVRHVLAAEPLCLRLQSPLFIMGDVHGNYQDLHFFLKETICFGQLKYTSSKFLFLGDYVDRGPASVQVAAYLLAMKVLSPDTVFLLRGNHECPNVNGSALQYGSSCFRVHCERAFGDMAGYTLWQNFNQAFAQLPVCAVVDEKVFCVHGGIPRYDGGEDHRLSALADPNFPRFESVELGVNEADGYRRKCLNLVSGFLWNDPADDEAGLDKYGFGPNPKRGESVHSFGDRAIETFLEHHGLQYIVRAHEVKQEGLRVSKSARVITVFTSSMYCGGSNGAAAVFLANRKVRFVTHKASKKQSAPPQRSGSASSSSSTDWMDPTRSPQRKMPKVKTGGSLNRLKRLSD